MIGRWLVRVAAVLACAAPLAVPAPAPAAPGVRCAHVPAPHCPSVAGLSAGGNHTCAFHNNTLTCWGYDGSGATGGGSVGLTMPPVSVVTTGALSGVTLSAVSAGRDHTCALSDAGAAYCWGDNTDGQLGDGASGTTENTPVAVDTGGALGGVRLIAVSAGDDHTCALSDAGAAYCWGAGGNGRLGDGTGVPRDSPVAVSPPGATLVAISAGGEHTCALSNTGAAYCWGADGSGQLGDGGSNTDALAPVAVASGAVLRQVTAGAEHTCALSDAGAAYCWGAGGNGRLGDGTSTERQSPVAVTMAGGTVLAMVSAGTGHTCAFSTASVVYCWGANGAGQLGDGTTTDRPAPVATDATGELSGVDLAGIATGTVHSCVLSTDDQSYCWGSDADQQLGDGTGEDQRTPARVRPGPPSGVAATAYDGALDVSWVEPLGLYGGTLDRYTATTDPGGSSCVALSGTGCWISGLANGTPYTVSVVAGTTVGDSVAAVAAEQATPVALPGPATGVSAAPGDGELFVSWTPPADPGTGTLTGYTAFADPGGEACESTVETHCTISGLDNGTEYFVTVVTHGTLGDSPDSTPAGPVTPRLPTVALPPLVPAANGSLASSSGTVFGSTRSTTLTGAGFAPGTPVLVGIYSQPRRLAVTTADSTGRFRVRITIPDGYSGTHTLVAVGLAASHRQRVLTLRITIEGSDDLAETGSGSTLLIATVVMALGLLAAGLIAVACLPRPSRPPQLH
jgi:alpha-tubulin suppressor-like RCC1 family protein